MHELERAEQVIHKRLQVAFVQTKLRGHFNHGPQINSEMRLNEEDQPRVGWVLVFRHDDVDQIRNELVATFLLQSTQIFHQLDLAKQFDALIIIF